MDHVRGDIDDPCGAIADFCGVIADFCGVIADPGGVVLIPEAIGQSAEYVKYAKIFGDYFRLIFRPTEDLGDPFLLILCLLKILASQWRPILAEVVRQLLPGLPRVMPGYSMGLLSVRQPELGLRVTPCNPLSVSNMIVG